MADRMGQATPGYHERIVACMPQLASAWITAAHVEAWMRSHHSTLDHLGAIEFRREVRIAVGCCEEAGRGVSDRLATSMGFAVAVHAPYACRSCGTRFESKAAMQEAAWHGCCANPHLYSTQRDPAHGTVPAGCEEVTAFRARLYGLPRGGRP